MNKPEKLSLIVGGSIIGGLALGFAGYKWYKNKQTKEVAHINTEEVAPINTEDDSDSDKGDYDEQIDNARGTPYHFDDDDTISITSTLDGGKKKKSRQQKKKKSKNNRKRHSKKRKKSKK